MLSKNSLSFIHLYISIVIILLLSNLTLKTLLPFDLVNISAVFLIGIIQFYYANRFGLIFFVTQLLLLSNFTYGNNQAGLYNFSTFLAIVILFSISKKFSINLRTRYFGLIFTLFLINCLGYVFYPIQISGIVQGFFTFSAFILIFLLVSNAYFSFNDFVFIFKNLVFIQFYSFVINLLKLFNLHFSSLIMFGGGEREGSLTQAGVMGNSELFAELNLIMLILVTILFLNKNLRVRFSIGYINLVASQIILSGNIFLTRSRSVILLYIFSLFVVVLASRKIISFNRIVNLGALVISIILFFLLLGNVINIEYSVSEFNELSNFKFSEENVVEGYALNRSNVFPLALQRLSDRDWLIGYGWGNTERNRISWGLENYHEIADYHSLYFSLPMLFGWVGSSIVVYLMITLALQALRRSWLSLITADYQICFQFIFLILIVLIVDQFKISALRDPNFFMIFWIFLAISNSITHHGFNMSEMGLRDHYHPNR